MANLLKITVEFIVPIDLEDNSMGKQIDRMRDSIQARVYDEDGADGTFEFVRIEPAAEYHK